MSKAVAGDLSESGSRWHRWDPHLHTPLTTLNNQFEKSTMEDFCDAIEACDPKIEVLGITDYCGLRGYEETATMKAAGRLAHVALIFPNVEIRLNLGTVKGSAINAHLLFSPEDSDHVYQIKKFLGKLTFNHLGEDYCCDEDDLVRLGQKIDPSQRNREAAYREGVNQFKVDVSQLRNEIARSTWAKKNCLAAVAVGTNDGTAGLRTSDGGFQAVRETVEAFADIIFSGNPKDSEFWLGRSSMSADDVEAKFRGLKPCIHGCDAHEIGKVGKPNLERRCWIKGSPTFESLRQACIEPADRVRVSPEMPRGSLESHTISSVRITNAPWMLPAEVPLNPGLVAIIGARGSGKTALADLIAAGGLGIGERISERSFISRAGEFLGDSRAELSWESGDKTGAALADARHGEEYELPRVQYLSQQFVDALCSAEGLTDSLVEEVRRVIFDAHSLETKEGASSFAELYSLRCGGALERRERNESALSSVATELLKERAIRQSKPDLEKQKQALEQQLEKDLKDKKRLVSPGQEVRVKRLEQVSTALAAKRTAVESLQKEGRAIAALRSDLTDFRQRTAPDILREFQETRGDVRLRPEDWELFLPTIPDKADEILTERHGVIAAQAKQLVGISPPLPEVGAPESPLIDETTDPGTCTVSLLQAEVNRLSKLIGIDKLNEAKYKQITAKIEGSQKRIASLAKEIARCDKADEHISAILERRMAAYVGVFDSIADLERELADLYAPLDGALSGASGALGKLKFVIRRRVDLDSWAVRGEGLMDLRKVGPFQGKGTLRKRCAEELVQVWQSGEPEKVGEVVSDFINRNANDIKAHRLESADTREWNAAVSAWLHSTDHLTVEYGLQYDGVDIERLSPGTRGIVLLLLYLEVDRTDDRPLIIDQPEENLDPQSVYDELVPRFRSARNRRQIIIVTHNANLVVNTDVDQVIVASAGQHHPGGLPHMTYRTGGLEDVEIRKLVCDILEGGERAFEARAKRLRMVFAK